MSILAINRSGLRTTVEDQFDITGEGSGEKPVVKVDKLTTEKFCAYIEGTASDPDGDELTVTISVDGDAPEAVQLSADGSFAIDWCGSAGDHQAIIQASDPTGLVGTATALFDLAGDKGCGCSASGTGPANLLLLSLLGLLLIRGRKD